MMVAKDDAAIVNKDDTKYNMLKFVCYFTVLCELGRRVGGSIFESTKFFKPRPSGDGVLEGTQRN